MAIRVLHTADWHIGSFPGPEINGENGRFLDVQDILNQFVTAAEREDPDFILIAGDVFHQAKVWSDRGLKEQSLCVNILRKLADIAPVLVMRGTPNHDSEEQFRTLETALAGNDRISIVTKPGIDFYTGKSGQFLQVACIPGFDKALFDAVNDTAESDSVFYSRELVKLVQEMSQQVNPRVPSILAAHYTIEPTWSPVRRRCFLKWTRRLLRIRSNSLRFRCVVLGISISLSGLVPENRCIIPGH